MEIFVYDRVLLLDASTLIFKGSSGPKGVLHELHVVHLALLVQPTPYVERTLVRLPKWITSICKVPKDGDMFALSKDSLDGKVLVTPYGSDSIDCRTPLVDATRKVLSRSLNSTCGKG